MGAVLKARSRGGSNFANLTEKVRAKVNVARGQIISNLFLLLTYLVIVSASSTIFQYFKCDSFKIPEIDQLDGVKKERYLFVDYSIDCDSAYYLSMRPFAIVMVLIYPVGIPVLYFTLLFKNRAVLR